MSILVEISWCDVERLVRKICKDYPDGVNILCCWRGGVPIAIAASNADSDHTVSIIKYQRLDSNDMSPKMMLDNRQNELPVILVEDIIDTGQTIKTVSDQYEFEKIYTLVLSNRAELPDIPVHAETKEKFGMDSWFYFPWDKDFNV